MSVALTKINFEHIHFPVFGACWLSCMDMSVCIPAQRRTKGNSGHGPLEVRKYFLFRKYYYFLLKWASCEKIVVQIRWVFRFWRGVNLGPGKVWAPWRPIFLFYWGRALLKNSGSNPVTFPFLEGLTLDPMKVCPPSLGKFWVRPWYYTNHSAANVIRSNFECCPENLWDKFNFLRIPALTEFLPSRYWQSAIFTYDVGY